MTHSWLDRLVVRAKKSGAKPRKAAAPAALAQAEKKLGVKFPAPLKAFYRALDGFGDSEAAHFVLRAQETRYRFVSLSQLVSEWTIWNDLLASGDFRDADRRMKKAKGDKRIAPVWWHPAWIPIAVDGGGNSLMIDLSPHASRSPASLGQIVQHWHDEDTRTVVARDLEALCDSLAWNKERQQQAAAKANECKVPVKAWVFTFRELPGFCEKERAACAKLEARSLDVPVLLMASPKRTLPGKKMDALYKVLPERGDQSSAEVKRVFALADKLELLVDKHAPDYFQMYLTPPGDVFTHTAYHDSASKADVIRTLRADGLRVDETPHVVDWDESFTRGEENLFSWITKAPARTRRARMTGPIGSIE